MKRYHLHRLKGNLKKLYALDLGRTSGYRLIIVPLDDNENEWKESDVNRIYRSTKITIVKEVSNHYE